MIAAAVSANEEEQRINTSFYSFYAVAISVTVDSMEKMDEEALEELNDEYKSDGYTFKITDGYEVSCTIGEETEHGEDESKKLLTMWKTSGIAWKTGIIF